MKLIFVIPSWSYRGGERIFINLALAMQKRGSEIVVIAGRKEKTAVKFSKKIKIIYPNRFNSLLNNDVFYFFFSWVFIYIEILKKIKGTDWIISESNHCLTASFLSCLGRKTKILWYVLAYESVHYENKVLNTIWELTFGTVERIIVLRVNKVTVLAKRVKKTVKRRFGVTGEILYPIINFNSSGKGKVKEKIVNLYKGYQVLFLPAALHWKKNQKIAIEAIASLSIEFPLVRLVLAGSGRDENYLRRLAFKLGVSNLVSFVGVITGESLSFCYRNAAMTLVCSKTENEGLSLTSFESLYYETPIVVSSEAGVADYIKEKNLGVVVGPTVRKLSNGIGEVLNNLELFQKQAEKASLHIKDYFNGRFIARSLMKMIEG